MTERNPYSPYSFDNYDQNQSRQEQGRSGGPIAAPRGSRRISEGGSKRPLFAGLAILLTGAVFAGIVISSYPARTPDSVPVIHADNGDIKVVPDAEQTSSAAPLTSPGASPDAPATTQTAAATAPQTGSAIFSGVQSSNLKESAPVENLLSNEKPMDNLEAFAKQAESSYAKNDPAAKAAGVRPPAPAKAGAVKTASAAPAAAAASAKFAPPPAPPRPALEASAKQALKSPAKIEPAAGESEAVIAAQTAPQTIHAAGSAPDTIAFLKSELQKKDAKAGAVSGNSSPAAPESVQVASAADTQSAPAAPIAAAPAINKATPASAAAISKAPAVPGQYYIQLASAASESGISSQWSRLQKVFPTSLGDMKYRVQKADVPGKGTFYRIQAGPLSKDAASAKCASIKADKPGGCIIVQ